MAQPDPPWKSWTADEWRARGQRAADYLARVGDDRWKVGRDVVAFYFRMANRLEHAPCPDTSIPSPPPTRTTPAAPTDAAPSPVIPSEACRTA